MLSFPKLPTMTNFTTIASLHLKFSSFSKLPNKTRVADAFQSHYSGQIPDHKRIFTNETTQDDIKLDTELNNTLRQIIVEEMIAPFAHQMGVDAADVIHHLFRNAGLWVSVKDSGTFLRHCITKVAMTKALTHARDTNRLDQVKILVDVNHLYFDNRSEITFLDFRLIGTTPFAAPPTPPAPPTIMDIATAVATAIQTNSPQPKDLGMLLWLLLGPPDLLVVPPDVVVLAVAIQVGVHLLQCPVSTYLILLVCLPMLLGVFRLRWITSLSPRLR